jgi:redox-sensitive bicupin YhaK (pirin superfamily)
MSIRPVKRLIRSKPTRDGAGVHLRRAFGSGNTSDFDPFISATSLPTKAGTPEN